MKQDKCRSLLLQGGLERQESAPRVSGTPTCLWLFGRFLEVTEPLLWSVLPTGCPLLFRGTMGQGQKGWGPLLSSMGLSHKEAQVVPLKTCGDNNLYLFLGQKVDGG